MLTCLCHLSDSWLTMITHRFTLAQLSRCRFFLFFSFLFFLFIYSVLCFTADRNECVYSLSEVWGKVWAVERHKLTVGVCVFYKKNWLSLTATRSASDWCDRSRGERVGGGWRGSHLFVWSWHHSLQYWGVVIVAFSVELQRLHTLEWNFTSRPLCHLGL